MKDSCRVMRRAVNANQLLDMPIRSPTSCRGPSIMLHNVGRQNSVLLSDTRSWPRGFKLVANLITVFLCLLDATATQAATTAASDTTDCARSCGKVSIRYPFGTSMGCGLSEFQLSCINDSSSGLADNPALFLESLSGKKLQVTEILTTTLLINATSIRATNTQGGKCDNPSLGNAQVGVPSNSPYAFTGNNNFFVAGWDATGNLTIDGSCGGSCSTPCKRISSSSVDGYCNGYGCCTIPITSGSRNLSFFGGGGSNSFSSVIYPASYKKPCKGAGGQYDLELGWAIEWSSNSSTACCDEAKNLGSSYACDKNAFCRVSDVYPLHQRLHGKVSLGYNCFCNDGYSGDGYTNGTKCVDIDECLDPTLNKCAANAHCTNTPGNYTCTCNNGYRGDGYLNGTGCVDINECLDPTLNKCTANATCTNTPGSYNCTCNSGSRGDGYLNSAGCVDINECSNSTWNQCASNADCMNTPGSYTCTCSNNGFSGNGVTNGPISGCHSSDDDDNTGLIVGVTVGPSLLLVIILLCALLCRKRRESERRRIELEHYKEIGTKDVGRVFSVAELHKATVGYSDEIGEGGFGKVYHGTLDCGTNVAVKKPNPRRNLEADGVTQLLNEVAVLLQLNHRNLVQLRGCCLEKRVPLLVYEYMSQGSLCDHLHGKYSDEGRLIWSQRLQIAIDTAEALAYLHNHASPESIIHRNIKSSNILLDDRLTAKVSDFGISLQVHNDATHMSTQPAGTNGYMDPETIYTRQMTDKSDVYSFGVVLLELITSQKPLGTREDSDCVNLPQVHWVPAVQQGNLHTIVDSKLLEDGSVSVNAIECVAQLAVSCLAHRGQERPSMKQVVEVLRKSSSGPTDNFQHRATI